MQVQLYELSNENYLQGYETDAGTLTDVSFDDVTRSNAYNDFRCDLSRVDTETSVRKKNTFFQIEFQAAFYVTDIGLL